MVSDKDVAYYITEKGKDWVCEVADRVVGFSIIDLLCSIGLFSRLAIYGSPKSSHNKDPEKGYRQFAEYQPFDSVLNILVLLRYR